MRSKGAECLEENEKKIINDHLLVCRKIMQMFC